MNNIINGKGIKVNVQLEEIFPEYCHTIENKCYIYLEASGTLDYFMDKVRYEEGKKPLYNSFNGCEIDEDLWYEYRIIVDLEKETADMVYCDCPIPDNEVVEYYIQIDDVMPQVLAELEKRGMTLEDLRNLE